MNRILILAAALTLTACVGAPVTHATQAACGSLPIARALVDSAIARGDRKMTKQDKADLATARALEDVRCAEAASAAK